MRSASEAERTAGIHRAAARSGSLHRCRLHGLDAVVPADRGCMDSDRVDDVAALAAGQHGVISAEQAALCGYDIHEIDRLCASGKWTRLRRGLYSPFPPPVDPAERMALDFAAALRALDAKDAAIAHISAAKAWGARWLTDPASTDVWIAWDVPGTPRYYPGLRILPAGLPPEDVSVFAGLPITTPARTAVDLARHLDFEPAVVVVDSLRFAHKITDAELAAVLERCRGWPYMRRARRAVLFSTMLAESPLESRFRIKFARIALPKSRWQVEVVDANGDLRRVDTIFGKRAGVEIDGRVKYKTPEDLWKEKKREDALREVGVPLLRLIADDLRGDPRILRRRVIDHMISTGDWIEGHGPAN